jgi:hypothetical protein
MIIRSFPVLAWFGALCGWSFAVEHSLSFASIAILFSIAFGSVLLGHLLCQILFKSIDSLQNVTSYLLVGILLGNVLLFILAFVSPFGIVMNWLFLLAVALGLVWRIQGKDFPRIFLVKDYSEVIVSLGAIFISTIWCIELLQPIEWTADFMRMTVWGDVFYHMSEINVFSRVDAISQASDILMGGMPFRPYHYASYLWPALVTRASGASSYLAFASFMLPVGLVVISLSAYILCSSIYGKPAGVVAGLFILLLPDPSQQGFGNLFLGPFHWSIQALPAMPYGLACSALAFASLFSAFRSQRWSLVLTAYVFVISTLLYKAHLFVAISYPALILPELFMGSYSKRQRIFMILGLTLVYAIVIAIANTIPAMPTMRLDGSGFIPYTSWLNDIQQPGLLKDWINSGFIQSHRLAKIIFYILFVSITTFGWIGIVYVFVYWKLRNKVPAYISLFPFVVGGVYLVMALGLALNTGGVGLGEELVQRPFIWAYYVMIVWTCAGAYYCIWGTQWPSLRSAQFSLGIFLLALLAVPMTFSKDIQGHTGSATLQVPICLYKTAQALEQHSTRDILFQESGGDDSFALMALSNRQGFVVDFHGSRLPAVAQQRLAQLKSIEESKNPQALIDFMKKNGIQYWVNTQEQPFAINPAGTLSPIYQCGAYTLYHLAKQ